MREDISQKLENGIEKREKGDFAGGLGLLLSSFENAKTSGDHKLIAETGNQLSICYRLISGRAGRKGNLVAAEEASMKALNVYDQLLEMKLLDFKEPGTMRNSSHAYLYAGFIEKSIPLLNQSADAQPNKTSRGDELCHLASALMFEDLTKAKSLLEDGLKLIEENEGSPIALTYGYMTEASLYRVEGDEQKAGNSLALATALAKEKGLVVRQEEIEFLQKNESANVLDAVSGNLRLLRNIETKAFTDLEIPEKVEESPIFLLFGGFQGSGKTTVIEAIKEEFDFLVLSTDMIRAKMFASGLSVDDEFIEIVKGVVQSLLRFAFQHSYSVAVDSNSKPEQIDHWQNFLGEWAISQYNVVTIFLDASEEKLCKRVEERPQSEKRYVGTVSELEYSLEKHGDLEKDYYDLVIDTSDKDTQQVIAEVKDFLISQSHS